MALTWRSASDHCDDEQRSGIPFPILTVIFFFDLASINVQDNVLLSKEILANHEICILRFFWSVFHPCVVGGCSGPTARFPGSLLVTTSWVAKHAGAPQGWRGQYPEAET